jgi:hypothetical protein
LVHFDYRATSEKALLAEQRSCCPLEPVLGSLAYD